jgi:TolB-like protein/Tfp pilus assembly protein PilF
MESTLSIILEWLDSNEGVISAIVGMIVIAGGIWSLISSRGEAKQSSETRGNSKGVRSSTQRDAKPSIAVLPFTCVGKHEDLEHLTDALTEDLTSLLSRSPYLFVIARSSSFVYKGRNIDVRDTAAELGVKYLVEGRVRQKGDRYRIDIELLDGESGAHIWVDDFECSLDDLLEVQADVMQAISTQLLNPILLSETSRIEHRSARDMNAWLLTQRAIRQYFMTTTQGPERAQSALTLLTQALKFDTNYAPALALKGLIHCTSILTHQSKDIEADKKKAKECCEKAFQLAPMDPSVLWCCGATWAFLDNMTQGLSLLKRSIEMDPNNAHALADYGYQLVRAGKLEEGAEFIERAFQHSPHDPRQHIWYFFLGSAKKLDPEPALEYIEKSLVLDNTYEPAWVAKLLLQLILENRDGAIETVSFLKQQYPGMNRQTLVQQLALGGAIDQEATAYYSSLIEEARLFE